MERPLIVLWTISLLVRSFHLSVERPIGILLFLILLIFPPCDFEFQDISKRFIVHKNVLHKIFLQLTLRKWTFSFSEVIAPFTRNACYRYSSETVNRRGMKPLRMSSTIYGDSSIYSLRKYSVTPSMSYCPWNFLNTTNN